jgi:ribosomal protein S18 acetylase RimI-like enzyme
MRRTLVLNDLFVAEGARRLGVGNALIDAAIGYGKEVNAKGIALETGNDNVKAQALYEKIGFEREDNYFYFYKIYKVD